MNKIIVATHKSYAFPSDDMYLPLFVGAEGKEDVLSLGSIRLHEEHTFADTIMRDDMDENISSRNPYYSELTGLYWAWKNLPDAQAIGLAHYRRYFSVKSRMFRRGHEPLRCVLTSGELDALLDRFDIIVPTKRIYAVETLYSHYEHTLDAYQLDAALEVVRERSNEYAGYVERVYARRWGYMFNMTVMRQELLNDYCSWLFDILFALEDRLRGEGYMDGLSSFEARLYGRVSEILFNAWVDRQSDKGLRVGEVPVISIEKENWVKKGRAFLDAKLFGKKYGASF